MPHGQVLGSGVRIQNGLQNGRYIFVLIGEQVSRHCGHDEEAGLRGLPALGAVVQEGEHMLENVGRAHDEDDILDELDDAASELGKVVALLQEAVDVRLHLAVTAK